MGKLRIVTNLPVLCASIFQGNKIIHENSLISTSRVTPFVNNENTEEIESSEFILDKGVYAIRLSLPYCNPGTIKDNESGAMYHMPVAMDKTVIIENEDTFVELQFFATLKEIR